MFFTEKELEYLKGTAFIDKIIRQKSQMKRDYVIYQTQEMAQKMLRGLRAKRGLIFYNNNSRAKLHGEKVSIESLIEPNDMIWKNLGTSKGSRFWRIVAVYVGLLVVFAFIFIPMIGINPISPHFFFNLEVETLSYGFSICSSSL